jgi:hypothetical protein
MSKEENILDVLVHNYQSWCNKPVLCDTHKESKAGSNWCNEPARVAQIASNLLRGKTPSGECLPYKLERGRSFTKKQFREIVKEAKPPYGRGKHILAAVEAEYYRQLPIYKERKAKHDAWTNYCHYHTSMDSRINKVYASTFGRDQFRNVHASPDYRHDDWGFIEGCIDDAFRSFKDPTGGPVECWPLNGGDPIEASTRSMFWLGGGHPTEGPRDPNRVLYFNYSYPIVDDAKRCAWELQNELRDRGDECCELSYQKDFVVALVYGIVSGSHRQPHIAIRARRGGPVTRVPIPRSENYWPRSLYDALGALGGQPVKSALVSGKRVITDWGGRRSFIHHECDVEEVRWQGVEGLSFIVEYPEAL